MKYDPKEKDALGSTIRCPCKHPSHGTEGCKNLMKVDDQEARCLACEDHVPYTDTV